MAVITISSQFGSRGDEIAWAVAKRLGYECVSGEVLAKAAHAHGLAEERLTRLGEAKPPLLDRLRREAGTYIAVMENAVLGAALQDDVVLVGRGGQWLLRGVGHVLRVRVIAPFDDRVRWLADWVGQQFSAGPGMRTAHHAFENLLRRDDDDKRGRMRYLYDCDLDDPLLYDVLINNARGDVGAAADAIARLAQWPSMTTTTESVQGLIDRALASSVRVALMMNEHTRKYGYYEIESANGVIRVATRAPTGAVEAVARSVAGVRDVQVAEVPVIPPSLVG